MNNTHISPHATASMQGLASHSIALLLGRGTPLAHIDDSYSLQRVSCLLIAPSIYRPTLRSLYWSIESHTGYGIILPPDMQMGQGIPFVRGVRVHVVREIDVEHEFSIDGYESPDADTRERDRNGEQVDVIPG